MKFHDPFANHPRDSLLKVSLMVPKAHVAYIRGISCRAEVFRIFCHTLIAKTIYELKRAGYNTFDTHFESAVADAAIILDAFSRASTVVGGSECDTATSGSDGRSPAVAGQDSSNQHDGRTTPSLRPQEPDATSKPTDAPGKPRKPSATKENRKGDKRK